MEDGKPLCASTGRQQCSIRENSGNPLNLPSRRTPPAGWRIAQLLKTLICLFCSNHLPALSHSTEAIRTTEPRFTRAPQRRIPPWIIWSLTILKMKDGYTFHALRPRSTLVTFVCPPHRELDGAFTRRFLRLFSPR